MSFSLISHFYNEEYLLPWWIRHHSKIFDNVIMINYHSTDKSVEIINQMCPHWKIIESRNEFFDAVLVDEEVKFYEEQISGYKICLNTTEFLREDFHNQVSHDGSNHCYSIPVYAIVDDDIEKVPSYDNSLFDFKNFGYIDGKRYLHNYKNGFYTTGRHSTYHPIDRELNTLIKCFKYAPWNDNLIKRKTQISNRIPQSDIDKGMGGHHIWSVDRMIAEIEEKKKISKLIP